MHTCSACHGVSGLSTRSWDRLEPLTSAMAGAVSKEKEQLLPGVELAQKKETKTAPGWRLKLGAGQEGDGDF